MENLFIEEGYKSPGVKFDAKKGKLELSGRSVPERTQEFFVPLLEWIDDYLQSPCSKTTFDFKLEYCNSSSTRYVLDILERLDNFYKKGNKIEVTWYYEEDDEDMYETGKSYQQILELSLNLISVQIDD